MTTITIVGQSVVCGKAEGEAVVTTVPLCFRTEYDPATGEVIGLRHPLRGQCLKNKVLIFPSTKGSCGNSVAFTTGCKEGNAPVALVCTRREPLAVLSCVVNSIPMVSDLEQNPFEVVQTGDYVTVDADAGIVTVSKRGSR
jgi:predicted aconitase with swiveling domain